jgi:hypothetical protein
MLLNQESFEEFVRLLDAHPEWLEALQERIVDEKAILRVLEKRAEVLDAVRRLKCKKSIHKGIQRVG